MTKSTSGARASASPLPKALGMPNSRATARARSRLPLAMAVTATPGTRRSAGTCTRRANRSEEHTSELQSQSNLVCRLLLEKKNKPRQGGAQQNRPAGHRRRARFKAPAPLRLYGRRWLTALLGDLEASPSRHEYHVADRARI